jgi:LmbE family N-acetylglucosaminyl deacetylase
MIRAAARRVLDRRMMRRTVPIDAATVARPAMVLAPHPDDETLGCGGLIAIKRDAGVPVTVVFLTDGSSSHADLIDRAVLASRRHGEAAEACRILGVDDDAVVFLPFTDGALTAATAAATDRVAELFATSGATQLILPHRHEPPADHEVVPTIADAALAAVGRRVQALMFPVWMWDQWPWTNPLSAPRGRNSKRQIARTLLTGGLGLRASSQFTHHVDVARVLDRKRAALAAHASQMSRADDRQEWMTLTDVAGGDWVRQLTGPTEFYTAEPIGRGHQDVAS